jgi:multidrug efflux pump subunit AcrA (membrane-fusion protein)
MHLIAPPPVSQRLAGRGRLLIGLLAAFTAVGCHGEHKAEVNSVTKPPSVRAVKPQHRKIVRVVGQPSFVESYEHTSIYPKLTGYIESWNVDIGDKVKKGDVLATLFVPELVEDFATKRATVKLDEEKVDLATKVVKVDEANVEAAKARLEMANAILEKYQAEVDRWDSEVKRLQHEVHRGVVDPQVLLESQNQWKSSAAARDSAKADIDKAKAELLSAEATLAKAIVAVKVAEADLSVAESEAKRIEAWVGYITLPAPFDGVVVERTANTGDFVMPATGDPSAMPRTPHISPGGNAAPIYVVERLDVVRIFVDVPEHDANYVVPGTKATVLVRAFRDQPIEGTVTRTSWALNAKSRTLRAEIDLPNPETQLLPGMYAYARVIIERNNALAVPVSALSFSGEKTYLWKYEKGHAVRTEIQTGVSDGEWIEVTNRRVPSVNKVAPEHWVAFDGSEQVLLDDQLVLTDGSAVEIDKSAPTEKVAATPAASPTPPSTLKFVKEDMKFTPAALSSGPYSDGANKASAKVLGKNPAPATKGHPGDVAKAGTQFTPAALSSGPYSDGANKASAKMIEEEKKKDKPSASRESTSLDPKTRDLVRLPQNVSPR